MKTRDLLLLLLLVPVLVEAQVLLDADGPGSTYELINSVLAPGYDVVENPECAHPEFGRHVTEVWDNDLGRYVFAFYIHVTPDNDRCIKFDRQRMEIKTYGNSPDHLIGVVGESVTYQWKFKLPAGFQVSSNFTHLHQVKAVGGDDADPLFTLTARKGSPDQMELIHDNAAKLARIPLALFTGNWVEVTEKIFIHPEKGTYSILIRDVSSGDVILSCSENDIMTIRPDNDFVRPKWGIYRSLLNARDLRDEVVRFSSFSISEDAVSSLNASGAHPAGLELFPVASGRIDLHYALDKASDVSLLVTDAAGKKSVALMDRVWHDAGEYSMPLNDARFAPGIYVVRMITSEAVVSSKAAFY